ncbi:hypothetical protein [Clostridium sp. BJN0013]|mgnify:FL=1|uniref:hypothetical protein n=1 Tax=Clostridium sp. BJN0013 TaxID=3236840 RepID=UPI0034C6893D
MTSFLTDTTTKMIYAIMPLFLMSIGTSKIEVSLIKGIAESTEHQFSKLCQAGGVIKLAKINLSWL